ncbi:TetR family transcriptional regulator [Catellatospora sp. TT07R-123]|uniref:TetR/AcrR family transcriptional regulator n=1 Tax=Catellatospora sp. TT07R-123 TaxID=2733863 RepID=UPI001B24D469|nr:TetR/AcrR family transcriptional regulator [Catellatospora sp. TT07R-123]GHJ50266.1 TetR family transcriptional regulator [Catellatospora sp. TT07R-123]
MTAKNLRARVRDELTSEIKTIARRQLATDGADLSLRAVARELGMVSSAVYRYFPSRDDLLTALIIDCYNELGEAAEQAVATAGPDSSLMERWLAVGHAVRDWALAHPADYALIYGSPVPGYHAPRDTVGPASRVTIQMLGLLVQGVATGTIPADPGTPQVPPGLAAELDRFAEQVPGVSRRLLARALTAWSQMFGAVNFELFGRLNNLIDDSRRELYDVQLRAMGEYLGLQ